MDRIIQNILGIENVVDADLEKEGAVFDSARFDRPNACTSERARYREPDFRLMVVSPA
jgi:hypothetical protein